MLFKKEVFTTRDNDLYQRAKNILTMNNIKYYSITNTPTNSGRHHNNAFIDMSAAYQYHIFVKSSDYDAAKNILIF